MTTKLALGLAMQAAACLLPVPSAIAAGRDCLGYDLLSKNPAVETGKVASADKRTFFLKGETEDKSCPSGKPTCQRKSFLVPGNPVLLSNRSGDFVCATYVNAKGVETNGWLPKGVIALDDAAGASAKSDWAGTWIREEAKITIKAGGSGKLDIHGDATFGASDPDKVKRGAVNIGEISGAIGADAGKSLSFTMGDDDKTLPVEKGDDSMCKVWMRRTGPYLLVDDNNACGGMNVSFRGTYVRR